MKSTLAHRFSRFLVGTLIASVATVACRNSAPPPPYLRLSGAAPAIVDAPNTRAQLIVFWAAWCIPCREEVPELLAFAGSPPADLSIVVVRTDSESAPGGDALGTPPDPSLHVRFDDEQQLFQAVGALLLPAAVLVVDGRLRARFDGARAWNGAAMRTLLSRLITESLPAE